jgi:multidrug efflux system outer membrane protein
VKAIRSKLGVALIVVPLFAGGCANFGKQEVPERNAATRGISESDRFSGSQGAPEPAPGDLTWWRRFDDPAMAQWVERALAANVDIAIAGERVEQALALLRSARAQRSPFVGAQASTDINLKRDRGERRVQPGAALTLDFDTDLWGGLRAAERAATAGVLRSEDLVQAARLSVAGLTARAYVEWRAALEDRRLLDDALALQGDALRVVSVRVDAGISPVLDRDRAQAEVADTEADRAAAGVRVTQALAALLVLAGEPPHSTTLRTAALSAPAQTPSVKSSYDASSSWTDKGLPTLTGEQPVARPLDLLRLRPDLRAAEHALVAAAADIGVAEAALRPRLRIPGTLIFGAAAGGGSLLEVGSAIIAAVLDVTVFDGGAAAAGVDAARSRMREATQIYRQTLLEALQQVESALAAQQGARRRIDARARGITAARAAEAQAQTLYRAGLVGYLDVVDAQRSALANQRELLHAQADDAAASALAFEAMGLIE